MPASSEARLLELRAAGLSQARIARELNAEAVPTAHGGAWHTSTVARILARLSKTEQDPAA
ncbi:recombinase family protein [Microbacterium allomyrinae]|uniref:recombinase family protein n=1 Tax=Microbacterium allomyrinae TaxID=2830666 RepID=UPI0035586908